MLAPSFGHDVCRDISSGTCLGRKAPAARGIPARHRHRLRAGQPDTISAARPAGAQQALITGSSDGDVLVSAVILRKQAPDLPITALVSSASVREALRELGVQHAVSAQELVARTLATTLETPHAGEMVSQLVESGRDILAEIDADPAAIGKPLSAVRDERAGLVLGLIHAGRFTLGISEDPVIAAGDRLLIAEETPRGHHRANRNLARRGGGSRTCGPTVTSPGASS